MKLPRIYYKIRNSYRNKKNSLSTKDHNLENQRFLEIGPGDSRIPGFETLNMIDGPNVDYVCDASNILPFLENTFNIIYASHILEHIPWYFTERALQEWTRILKPGGSLEIWIPDGVKICRAFVDAESGGPNVIENDGWYRFNPGKDPCLWASGRLFTYGDGKGKLDHQNWHRAIFSRRYIKSILEKNGLIDIREMNHSEIRGYDHGWINMGIKGTKK